MSDELHDDLARRLREQGQATAPADLRTEVMAQVAAEPRHRPTRRRRLWRPVLATAAIACAIGGVAIGMSHLGDANSSSSGAGASSGASAAAEDAIGGGTAAGGGAEARTYTVPRAAANALFDAAGAHVARTPQSIHNGAITVTVPPDRLGYYRNALSKAQSRLHDAGKAPESSGTTIVSGSNAGAAADQDTVKVILKPHDNGDN